MRNNYQPHEIQLANEIADALQDRKSLSFYLSMTRRHSETFLRETLAAVMAIDEKDIWKSRGAYFTDRIANPHKYGNSNSGS